MSVKWRLFAWGIYTLACFLIMLIGFSWKVSIPVSIIVGFICGLLNEVIQIMIKASKKFEIELLDKKDEKI